MSKTDEMMTQRREREMDGGISPQGLGGSLAPSEDKAGVILEAMGVKKVYRLGSHVLEVLKGVTLHIHAGDLVAIVGPSGAGKSTLLHILGGLDRPTQGVVRFEGKAIYALKERQLARIRNRSFGFVFQFYHLVPELTAWENVALPGWIGRIGSSRLIRQRAWALLERVGLKDRARHLPSELSGGEQQRVAIARALMNDPQVVFCDEPTGNLDSATGEAILRLLLDLNRTQHTTLVIVTHEPMVTRLAKRIWTLRDGQISSGG
jgi:putative ABC transport system ATP-binding protein